MDISEAFRDRNAEKVVAAILSSDMGLDAVQLMELFQNCTKAAQRSHQEAQKKRSLEQSTSLGEGSSGGNGNDLYHTLDAGSFLEPRGRFKVLVSAGGITLDGKTACFVSWQNIAYAMLLPAHQTTKKEGEDLIAFTVQEPVEISNGKQQKNFLWKLAKDPKKLEDASKTGPPGLETHDLVGTESAVITALFSKCWNKVLDAPKPGVFQTLAGKPKPFLQCYKGIQEGVLYPLATGILFVKPMVFLSAAHIDSIVAGRGGSAQTRYIDLVIHDVNGGTHEFTNIDREELQSLQSYVQLILKESQRRLKRAAEKEAEKEGGGGEGAEKKVKMEDGSAAAAAAVDDSDSDESDDDDYDPNATGSDSDEDGDGKSDDDDGDSEDDEDYEEEDDGRAGGKSENKSGDDTASEGGDDGGGPIDLS